MNCDNEYMNEIIYVNCGNDMKWINDHNLIIIALVKTVIK